MENINKFITYNFENGQCDASFLSNNLEEIEKFLELGWKCQKMSDGYYMRAPNDWLVDMTESKKIMYFNNPLNNLAYYLFLNNLFLNRELKDFIDSVIKREYCKFEGFNYHITEGPIVQSEFRIIGIDSRVSMLRNLVYHYFLDSNSRYHFFRKAKEMMPNFLNPIYEEIPIDKQRKEIKSLFFYYDKVFSMFEKKTYNSKIEKLDLKNFPFFNKILLAPTGCFDMLSTIISSMKLDRKSICFYEVHSDPNKIGSSLLNCNLDEEDKVIVLDKAYTGKSLEIMRNFVLSKGATPITVSYSPKSRGAVKKSQFIIIAGHCLKVNDEIINSENWILKCYLESFTP